MRFAARSEIVDAVINLPLQLELEIIQLAPLQGRVGFARQQREFTGWAGLAWTLSCLLDYEVRIDSDGPHTSDPE
jgi:hypothetical protein